MLNLSTKHLIRELLDGVSDQVYAIDALSGRILDCNDGSTRALGYTREELLERSVPDFDRTIDLATYQELVERIVAADREVTLTSTHTRKDGTTFPVEITCRVRNVGGRQMSLAVVRDMTAKLELETELREQTHLYQSIVRGLPGTFSRYRLGDPSVVLFIDERITESTGYSQEEFRSGAVRLGQIVVPEDRERVGAALRHAVESGETTEVTYRLVCKDGTEKVVRDVLQGYPPDESGMPLIEAISFDVTESARREQALKDAWSTEHERFEQVARAAGIVIYDRDMRANRIEWSGPYEEVLGYGREEIGGQEEWERRVPAEDARRVIAATADAYAEGRMVDVEYRFRRKDGQERWLWLRGIPLMDSGERIVRSIGMLQDITKRRQLETQLSSAQRMDTVGALAGGIAHDVNNYLTTIMGNLDLAIMAQEGRDSPELRDARAAAAGCAELVQSLLTFARHEEGQRVRLRAANVIADAARILGRLAGPDIAVELSVAPECPDFDGDAVQIQQVLMNLAVNARDAMKGSGQLTIGAEGYERATRGSAEPARFVRIWVRDTGPGVAPEVRDRIFEPYFTTRPFGEGTGLGLAIVHGIARAHGGWAEVGGDSSGAEFSVFVPAAEATAAGLRAGGK